MQRLMKALRGERGQNTAEYIIMLCVLVAVVGIVGSIFKPQISTIFASVMSKIGCATNQ